MTSTDQRFWTALESVPGLSAVASEWRSLLGPDYEAGRKYLRPDGRLASAIACPFNACACAHDVVHHGDDDFVTVCRCDPRECPTAAIPRADLVLYEVDRQGVCDGVATAFGASPEHAAVDGLPMTWSIGTYIPRTGFRFPVYLSIQGEPDESQRVIDALLRRAEGPFVVAVPTRSAVRQAAEDGLHRRKGHLLVLAEDVLLGSSGSFELRRPLAEALAPFLAMVLPAHGGSTVRGPECRPSGRTATTGAHHRDGCEHRMILRS